MLKIDQNKSQYDIENGSLIINGDARHELLKLPPESVDCVITSPPYFKQRNYGGESNIEIGTEKTITDYISNLVDIFGALVPALKPEGSLWLNLGDKYIDGELAGIPWQTVFALRDSGWFLRSDVIWHKPNAMPSSVKNRPGTDHEYLFLLTRSKKYFYDNEAVREPHVTFTNKSKMRGGRNHFGKKDGTPEKGKFAGYQGLHDGDWSKAFNPNGRNRRTVWSISLSKFRGAHFAVFPEKLVEPCLLASCPKKGRVLDPFFGSGTVGVVALKNNRQFIGVEQNKEYCEISLKRLQDTQVNLPLDASD